MEGISFASCKLFTDSSVQPENTGISVISIPRVKSSADYTDFILSSLVDHIDTGHCLIVQWDGHVLDVGQWKPEFLDYDYIGASWPQFDDGHEVGNGGFSLRSRRLMEACRAPEFTRGCAEDLAIGRVNRDWLESCGMRFAPRVLADQFSAERAGDVTRSFGYHGAWLMPQVTKPTFFWELYCGLDDRTTIWHDFRLILKQVRRGRGGWRRVARFLADRIRHAAYGWSKS